MSSLRQWYAEISTKLGLFGLAVAISLIVASFIVDQEKYGDYAEVLRNLGVYLAVPGLIGVLYREKPKPPECD